MLVTFVMDVLTVTVGVHVYFMAKDWRDRRRYR
mgnify:FL=1|jgi:hypothetical protein